MRILAHWETFLCIHDFSSLFHRLGVWLHRPSVLVAKWDINKYERNTGLKRDCPLELTRSCWWGILHHPIQILNSQYAWSDCIYFTATHNWYRGLGPGSACSVVVICLSTSSGKIFHDQLAGHSMSQHCPCSLNLEQLVFAMVSSEPTNNKTLHLMPLIKLYFI